MYWIRNTLYSLATGILYAALIMGTAAKAEEAKPKVPLNDIQRFTTAVEYIKNYYVKPVEDTTLFENAMRGMLSGLDPHSSYLDIAEFDELNTTTTGKFGGLGVEVLPEDGFIRVISPIDDTPAQRAGIQAGDLIIRLNETLVKGLTMREAIELMRGEKGTTILLTIIRQGETKPLRVNVIRDIINVQSVRSKMLEDNFGYVRISQFQKNSGDDLNKALEALKKSGRLKGLILDLRNNPGGVLNASIQVSDAFLDRSKLKYDGMIVYTKGRLANSQTKEKAHAGDILNGAPLVVLVNEGSASASEIVAGALQDHRRAIIVGKKTFGKGSVQHVLSLKDKDGKEEGGLKLTTALYYTPAGRSIQATGIKPDIVIQNLKIPAAKDMEQHNPLLLREEDLQGHLEHNNADNKTTTTEGLKQKAPDLPLIHTDYQLHEALNVLKGLVLMAATK